MINSVAELLEKARMYHEDSVRWVSGEPYIDAGVALNIIRVERDLARAETVRRKTKLKPGESPYQANRLSLEKKRGI